MTRRSDTKHVVIHCSATKPTLDIGRRQIREWHIGKGWTDIGYSLVIRRNGLCEMGRHPDEIGAHVAGHNSTSVGICLVGGLYPDGTEATDDFGGLFTPEQGHSLKEVIQFYRLLYPSAVFLGHRDLSPDKNKDGRITRDEWLKTCPGFDVGLWMKAHGF